MMTKNNSTTYSIVGSMGIHVFFTLGAGSFLMNINNNLQPQKTYQMEFIKRKVPPPVKKETIRKEPVLKEIKVASLTPKAMPVLQPKISVRQTSLQTRKVRTMVKTPISTPMQVKRSVTTKSVVIRSSMPSTTKRIPVARSFVSSSKTFSSNSTRVSMVQGTPQLKLRKLPQRASKSSSSVSSSKGSTRVALVQGTPEFKLSKLPQRVTRSENSSSTQTEKGRVTPVQTGVKLASLTPPSPRGVPNIVDTGALKSYIGQVRRSVLGAKRYPEASRRAGRQGNLKVKFTILKNGEVGNVTLLTETPYPNLNREAMAAVKRAAPFAGIPDSIMQQSLQVVLPFGFELN
ncbi:MAG: energy transducer TonB [Nitrospinota bacterium]|nr:energy transducer TonB [Nitrospinota bacterium]